MDIAVLGGGHGCYAAAADMAEAGHQVRFWRRDAAAFAPVLAAQGFTVTDAKGTREVKVALATTDVAEAIRGADLILAPLPGTAQAGLAEVLAPHLSDGQVVYMPPGTFRQLPGRQAGTRRGQHGGRRLGRRRHAALAGAQAAGRDRADHDARHAAAQRRVPGAALGPRVRRHRAGLPIGRAPPRRAGRRAAQLRAHHPSAADPAQRRAVAALRRLGHPQRRHPAIHPQRRRRPGRRARRDPRGARLRRAALPAGRPLQARPGRRHHVPASPRTTILSARATGARTSTSTPTATCARTWRSASHSWSRSATGPGSPAPPRAGCSPLPAPGSARTSWRPGARSPASGLPVCRATTCGHCWTRA